MAFFGSRALPWPAALALVLGACLEPNPNADGGETGTTTATTTTTDPTATTDPATTGDPGPDPCDPCELAFATVSFDAGPDGTSVEVPKPDQPNTTPLALVREYRPGGAEALGYELSWTETDTAWQLDVSLSDAANDSSVAGVAVVIGTAAPASVATIELGAADGCASAAVSGASAGVVVHALESYQPATGAVASYAGTRSDAGDEATIEYCFDQTDSAEASLRARAIGFETGEGPIAEALAPVLADTGGGNAANFATIPANIDVVQLVAATSYDDSSAADFGYAISCDATAPYGCSFDPVGFKGGTAFTVAGAAVGIP